MQPLPPPNILTEVRLEGFKAHKDSTFSLAPITLILGSNSAGKSSLFQALLTLKQSLDRGPNRFTDLLTDGPKAQLGRFGNVQHGLQANQEVAITLVKDGGASARLSFANRFPNEALSQGFLASENVLGELTLKSAQRKLSFGGWSSDPNEPQKVSGEALLSGARVQLSLDLQTSERTIEVRPILPPFPDGSAPKHYLVEWEEFERECSDLRSAADAAEDSTTTFIDEILLFVRQRILAILHVGPLRIRGQRSYDIDPSIPNDAGSAGEHLATLLVRPGVRDALNAALAQLEIPYELVVNELPTRGHTVGILLQNASGSQAETVGIQDVGFGVSQVIPVLLQQVLARANFESEYANAIGALHSDRTQWSPEESLWAEKRRAAIPRSLVLMEQPELHLHPRVCVELVRYLADVQARHSTDGGKPLPFDPSAQFLIETHSETIVEAVQQLVRLGYLSNSDVSILSVEPPEGGASGSVVRRIRLDEDGEFLDKWPRGFFTEHRRLAFGRIETP